MTVRVLRKAVAVLETLSAAGRPVGLAELARRMKYPKPTIYRILRSFQELGYLARDRETGCYVPTSRLAQLGRHGHMLDLRRRALPAMEELHEEFDETVNLGVLEGDQISYAACLETTRPLRLMVRPGSSDPFYCTALGRAIAAFLPDREREELVSRVRFQTRTPKTVRTRAVLERSCGTPAGAAGRSSRKSATPAWCASERRCSRRGTPWPPSASPSPGSATVPRASATSSSSSCSPS
jgi:DNA-binding IclR family transcriptional regulator